MNASSARIVQILSEKAKNDPTLQLHLEAATWQAVAMELSENGEAPELEAVEDKDST